jgi:hypothetical protein
MTNAREMIRDWVDQEMAKALQAGDLVAIGGRQ